jgi:hypothetical protein
MVPLDPLSFKIAQVISPPLAILSCLPADPHESVLAHTLGTLRLPSLGLPIGEELLRVR